MHCGLGLDASLDYGRISAHHGSLPRNRAITNPQCTADWGLDASLDYGRMSAPRLVAAKSLSLAYMAPEQFLGESGSEWLRV